MATPVYTVVYVVDLEAIRAIPDPVARIRAVNAAIAEATARTAQLADITNVTVREMRRTMSLAEVAQALGVSRGRVQQLSKPRSGAPES